jgi:hypothetical protein
MKASAKASAFAFMTFLAVATAISTANSAGVDHLKTGTAFNVAQQYADAGAFGGVTSGTTGAALEVARDSMNFLGSSNRIAARWPMPPILAQGD